MESLQTKTARAVAQNWLRKQEAFIQTLAPALRDEVRRQLGCISNIDAHSVEILNSDDEEETLFHQLIASYSGKQDGKEFVTLEDATVQPIVAQLLGVDPNLLFMSAMIDFTNSTLKLTRSVTGENFANLKADLMEAGMSEKEYADEMDHIEEGDEEGDKNDLYALTYTVPILLLVGTRIRKDYEPHKIHILLFPNKIDKKIIIKEIKTARDNEYSPDECG